MRTHGVAFDLDDKRTLGTEIDVRFGGTLTPVQQEAAEVLLAHDLGVLVAPPGVGKTVIGTYLVAKRRRSTLILVHRGPGRQNRDSSRRDRTRDRVRDRSACRCRRDRRASDGAGLT